MREPGHITHVDSPYIVPRGDKSALGDMNMQWQSVWLVLACMPPDAQFIPLPHSKQKNKTNEPQHYLIKSFLLSTKKCSSAFFRICLKTTHHKCKKRHFRAGLLGYKMSPVINIICDVK